MNIIPITFISFFFCQTTFISYNNKNKTRIICTYFNVFSEVNVDVAMNITLIKGS